MDVHAKQKQKQTGILQPASGAGEAGIMQSKTVKRRVGSEKGGSILAWSCWEDLPESQQRNGSSWGSDTEKKWKNNPPPIRARKMHERDLSTFVSLLSSTTLCAVEFACHIFSQDFQDEAIPGQKTKAESFYYPMDLTELLIKLLIK